MAHRQHGFRAMTDGTSHVHGAFGVEHSRPRFLDEHASRFTEIDDFLALAEKQWKAKTFFELGHLFAECRLANI